MRSRVLVFEDNDALRSLIVDLLESRGFDVVSYSEPGHCSQYLEGDCSCPFEEACADAIITDLNMPGMTGLSLVEERIRHGCKVIGRAIMSGGWTEKELQRARELDCQTFEKPFRLIRLVEWLEGIEKQIDPHRRLLDLKEPDSMADQRLRRPEKSELVD
jgi:CheY-like chemotaxis protein